MLRKHAGKILILSFCLLAAGCAGLGIRYASPKVSLVDIRVQEVRTLETVFLVYLRVLNPNETALTIQGIDCELIINGYNFATGLSGENYRIGPYESALVPVTVYASTLEMVSSVVDLLRRIEQGRPSGEPLRYEMSGHIRLAGTGWSVGGRVPFETRGELVLPAS